MTRLPRRAAIVTLALAALATIAAGGWHAATASPRANPAPLVVICPRTPCANAQELEVFDGNGAPIMSVGEYGGLGVFGDQLSVLPPGDVYHPVVQLRDNGTVVLYRMQGGRVTGMASLDFAQLAWLDGWLARRGVR